MAGRVIPYGASRERFGVTDVGLPEKPGAP